MEFTTFLKEQLSAILPEVIAAYEGDVRAASLSEMEKGLKAALQEVGGEALEHWLAAQTPQYPADEAECPHCGAQAHYVRWREGMSITLLGRVTYRRPYYECPRCRRGHCPLDEALGIAPGQMSDEVQQVAALLGANTSFARSSDLLQRVAHLALSPNSIRKATQQMGERVIQQETAQLSESQRLEAQRQHRRMTDKPRRLYGSLDGFMVHIEEEWHEMKAGTWWRVDTQRRAADITYYTDWQPAAEFSALTWATGFQRLADQADEVIFVADGADWIWRIVQEHFPHAVQIVDWYHAFSYVRAVAQAAFTDETARQTWLKEQQTALWHGQRATVFHACRAYAAVAPEPVKRALTFFAHQRSRMRYDRYRAAGYQIGSGTMESGCKQLGQGRLKIAGAQWGQHGARLVAKARAAFLSGQWDALCACVA
jgi:hypothetical protein